MELGAENADIIVLDADLSESTRTCEFAKEFPKRFFNMGIAEQNMLGTAAGLALSGKIPFVSTFAVFASMRSSEQVRTSIAYPRLNVKIVVTHSGLSIGTAGATHFCEEDLAIMRAIPNMAVIAPADFIETKAAVRAAARYDGPVYIRLGRGDIPDIYKQVDFEIGKGITANEGSDITLVATGVLVHRAMEIAKKLSGDGISARVIDMHTVKPLDKNILVKAARETKGIITLEDHNILGGLGSAVAEVISEEAPGVVVKRLGIPDVFGGVAPAEALWEKYGMSVEVVSSLAVKMVNTAG